MQGISSSTECLRTSSSCLKKEEHYDDWLSNDDLLQPYQKPVSGGMLTQFPVESSY